MLDFDVRNRMQFSHQSDAEIAVKAGLPVSFISDFRHGRQLPPSDIDRIGRSLDY